MKIACIKNETFQMFTIFQLHIYFKKTGPKV